MKCSLKVQVHTWIWKRYVTDVFLFAHAFCVHNHFFNLNNFHCVPLHFLNARGNKTLTHIIKQYSLALLGWRILWFADGSSC